MSWLKFSPELQGERSYTVKFGVSHDLADHESVITSYLRETSLQFLFDVGERVPDIRLYEQGNTPWVFIPHQFHLLVERPLAGLWMSHLLPYHAKAMLQGEVLYQYDLVHTGVEDNSIGQADLYELTVNFALNGKVWVEYTSSEVVDLLGVTISDK